MAENKQKFTYLISADTSEAKKLIADLQKSLDRVLKFNFDNFNIAPDLVKASRAAEELSGHLRAATNVNTGQLDLSKFNLSIRNSNSSLTNLMSDLAQGGSVGQAAFEQMTAAIARTLVPLRLTNALIKEMATSLKNTIKWELSSAAVHGLESALSGAVNYAKDLNTSLTNIRIVTGQTVEDMARFTKEANAAAKSLSTTTKSYADASLIYYQQGDSQEMAAKKAAITIKAANSSFETTAKEMSEYLTSVWNSYLVGADELERYVDIMAALGAKTATSLEEIATSMQKVAATANTVGVSMEQVSSIISTVSSVTRESAESIGTSYKTIFARIGDLKLGETLDDGVNLGSVSSKLLAIGVSILDANGDMREMGDIITDLGNRWQTMNLAQKTAVALVVAGKRQYTQLMALFENWDMYQNNMNIAKNAEGSLQKMADIYAESWEAASARVRTSFEGIFNSIINDLGLIKLTNFVADFVDGIGSAIDSVGGLNGVLRLTSSILMKTFSKEAGARIKDIGHSVIGAFLDPKKNYQLASNQIKDLLMEINNKKQVDAQILLIESKNKLLEVEEYLSTAQKLAAQVGIADIEAQANKVKELEDAYTELRNSISNVNINRLGAARSSFSDVKETLGEAFTRYSNKITNVLFSSVNLTNDKGLLNVYDALYRSTQMADLGNQSLIAISPKNLAQYDNLEQRMSIVRQEAESLRAMMEDLGITIDRMPIEKLKGMLDKTDWDDRDIESLREALAKLSTDGMLNCSLLLAVLNQFFKEISLAGYSALDIERLRAAFDRVSNSSDDLAAAERNLTAASENLNLKTNKLNQTLDKQSMSFEKAAETAMDLGSGALDLINGFSAISDVSAQWGDESLSLADKLGSLLSTVLSLGMAVPSLAKGLAALGIASGPAGWIALAAAASAGVLGFISGQEEAKKTKYQEKLTKNAEKMVNEANLRNEELNNIQTLMKNYNTLRETYNSTGEGQEALAASARELAEAYGLVGANVLIAEGNFTAFERMIAQSTGLKQTEEFYQSRIDAIKADMNDPDRRSKYAINGWGTLTADEIMGPTTSFVDNADASDYIAENIDLALLFLTERQYEEAERLVASAIATVEQNRADYGDALSDKTRYEEMLMPDGSIKKKFDPFGLNTIAANNWWGLDNLRFNPKKMEKGKTEIQDYFSDLAIEGSKEVIDQLTSIWENLGTEAGEDRIISDSQITSFISQMEEAKVTLIKNALESATATVESFFEPDGTFIGETDLATALTELDGIKTKVTTKLTTEFAEELKEASGFIEDLTEYFDYTTGLLDAEGKFNYTDENKIEWHRQLDANLDKLYAEQNAIKRYRETHTIEEGSAIDKALDQREQELSDYKSVLESIYNKDLAEAIAQMDTWENAKNRAKIINETIKKMLGKSEQNTDYSVFDAWVKLLEADVEATALADERFKDIIEENADEKNGYKIKEGYDEEFRAIRDLIVSGYISDFTSFDDYLVIYKDLAAIFTDSGEYEAARTYIDSKKIKNARLVNNRLIHAMQTDLKDGDTVGANAERVLALNQLELDAEKSVQTYNDITSLASKYKDDLSFDDALALLQALIEDGNIAWEEFIEMDSDARKTYLESRRDAMLEAAKTALIELAKNAHKEQELLYATEADYEEDKRLTDIFFNNLEENFEYEEETGKYKHKTIEGVYADESQIAAMEARRKKMQDYESLGKVAEDAEDAADAFELLDSNNERAVTKILRMKNAISELPKDMKEFNKLVVLLGSIDPKKLIEMSDLERAQLILKELEEPTKAQFTVIDKETGKKVFNAAGYNEAMQEYEASIESATNVILESANKAFTLIENRMNNARKEAEKTKTIAETLSGAIETGELTETQKLGMSPELIQQWEQAADAPARAAIAMKQWNKYANENAAAARELITTYSKAEKIIFTIEDITSTGALKDSEKGKENFRGMLALMDLDEEIKSVWEKAWDLAVSKGVKFDGKSDFEIIELLRNEIGEMGELTKEEMDAVTAAVKDNMTKMFQELHNLNIELALSAAKAWLDAFNAINDAKLKLLSGGNILEMIAGDPLAILTMAKNTGKTISEIINEAMSGSLKASDFKDFNINEYIDTQMAAAGMFEGFGLSRLLDMYKQGYDYDIDTQSYRNRLTGVIATELQVLGPIYETMLKAINPTATLNQILNWLNLIFADSAKYTSLLVEPMNQLTDATIGAGLALNAISDQKLIEAASDVTQQEAEFNGQKVKYKDLTEVLAAIDRALQAKYSGESWESLNQEDRDLLGLYGIDFNNVDTAATECASALAACAQAALDLMKATAEQEGYTQNKQGEWGLRTYTAADGTIYTEASGRDKFGSDWDSYKQGLTDNGWVKSEKVNESFDKAQKAVNTANGAVSNTGYQTYERMASSVGMTTELLESYCERMVEAGKITEEAKDALMEVARSLARTSRGFDKVEKSLDDYMKTLQKTNKTSAKYEDTLDDLRDMYGDVLDLSADLEKDLPDAFLESEENARLLKIAMKDAGEEGDKAYDQLLANAAKSILLAKNVEISPEFENALYTMASQVDQFEVGKPITLGEATQISPDFGAALNALVLQAAMAGDLAASIIQAAAKAMGFDAEVETKTFPVKGSAIEYRLGATIYDPASKTTYVSVTPNVTESTGEVTAVALKTITPKGVSGGGIRSGSGGGSGGKGGGGGSKQKETKKYKRYQDEIERYHKNNETLSRVSELLDKIEKQKERVYGAKYIDRIDEETEALKRQLEAQQALYDEANKYIAADKVSVARYGAIFDQEGTIVNYEEVMRNIIDEYNRAVDTYNASDQEDGAKKALEAAEERYNDAKKSIENYEEAILKANETANNMLETRNKLSAAEVEKITYKLEFKLEMNERDLALLEYYQDKYAELLDKQDDLLASYFDAAAEYELNLNAIGEAYNSLVSKYAAGLITEQDYAEQLEELHSKALDNLKSLNEVEENLIDSYAQALELAQEQVEKTTSSIESANETLQSYMDILNLYEGVTDYKKMANFYDIMNKNNITNIEVQKRHLDVLLAEEDKFQEKIRNGQELTELEKKEYEALEEQILDTRETLLSTTLEALETIRSTYENTINGIADDLDNFMAGSAGSLSYLQELYELFQEEQEQYVSTTKELYEVSKLNRDIEGSIADATSKASKEALKALQEKINKQSELNQLTEYDLQMNQLEYQLLLARINLEETKNAKDVVRLTRDDNGNYAYRYTANQDKIDEAAQKYEDVLQQINELTVERISDTEQKLVNAMANYKEKFVEIATDYTLTEEERLMKLEELTNNFSKNMQYIQEQNLIATDNLATNQEMIADYYGASMSEITSSTAGNVNDNIQSMMNKTLEYVEYMNNAIYGKDGWQTAWKEYIAGLGNIKESSGQAYEDMMNNALEMGEMNDFSAEQAENVLNVLEDTLEPLTNLTEAWNVHNAILNNTIETYENLAQVILGTLAAIGQIPNTVGAGDAKTTIDGKAYARGGLVDYTGLAWVDGTPDDPELMLNAGDTQNILAAASVANSLDKGILRTLMESVSTTAQAMLGMLSNAYHAVGISPVSSTTLDQQVHITAEFPNVTDHNEIEEALSTLVNRAAQFANHK